MLDDDAVLSLAIDRQSRGRYRLLLADPKKRHKLLGSLDHRAPLDERRTVWCKSFTKAVESVSIKPTAPVYIFSAASELDGRTMPFAQAIAEVPFQGRGTIILISPDLAIYYGEQNESAAVIRNNS